MYAIAQVIGTGSYLDPYRADVSGTSGPCLIPSNPDGSPKKTWCLIELREPDNAAGVGLIKLESKDVLLQSKLNDAGIVIDITNKTDQVIADEIGKQLNADFKAKKISALQWPR